MKLIYSPKDGERREWQLDADDLNIGEVKLLEKASGLTLGEIGDAMEKGSATVTFTFLWLFQRREDPTLSMTDMDSVKMSEIEMVDDEESTEDPAEAGPKDSGLSAVS